MARDDSLGVTPSPRREGPPKVALINSIIAEHDAISASVVDTRRALMQGDAFRVSLFCYRNDYPDLPANTISSVDELLFHRDYLDADVLIWHFGVTYELFNAVMIGNGRAPRVARFHNVTPKEFMPKRLWETVDNSLLQCHLLTHADEVWGDSAVNAALARDLGVDPAKVHEIPLVVEGAPVRAPTEKADAPVRILFVGRFVPSKGLLDLLKAIDGIRRGYAGVPFRLDLAGNVDLSDPDYVAEIRAFIETRNLHDIVTMHGTVDNARLADLYASAQILAIPSYHEGFCKPVIESLRAGCIPVGYAAYNLPYIVNGFGRLVPPGDVDALTEALRALIVSVPAALQSPRAAFLPLDMGTVSLEDLGGLARTYVESFSADRLGAEMRARLSALLER